MKEFEVWPGDTITRTIPQALSQAPCFFVFNGCRVEVEESMVGHEGATDHLYNVYQSFLMGKDPPVWSVKPPEKPCKTCSRNNFITDNKCWWCQTENPCR